MRLKKKLANSVLYSFLLASMGTQVVEAGATEQAKRMHDRLVGIPPSDTTLNSMATKIADGEPIDAAYEAMDNPVFYSATLKDFASPWTNRDQSVFVDLNDFTATVIGVVRDDVPFNFLLSEDIAYIGSAAASNNVDYSQTDNNHYLELQNNNVDLSDPNNLVRVKQTELPGNTLPASATAGVTTTRGFAQSFLQAGTNRAALNAVTTNFLCKNMEDLRDITARPEFVRQDVTRSPGGDSDIFFNDCLSCHAGMDALAGAHAYYDFDEDTQQIVYTAGQVQPKYLQQAGTFRYGYATTDDRWINYWRNGPNSYLGWNGFEDSGNGAKSLGEELATTRQFAECQVQQVFEQICYRTPNGEADLLAVANIATRFEQNRSYSMKRVFAETATYCMGE